MGRVRTYFRKRIRTYTFTSFINYYIWPSRVRQIKYFLLTAHRASKPQCAQVHGVCSWNTLTSLQDDLLTPVHWYRVSQKLILCEAGVSILSRSWRVFKMSWQKKRQKVFQAMVYLSLASVFILYSVREGFPPHFPFYISDSVNVLQQK